MKIKDLPKYSRPQEKLIRYGTDRLTNTELLAIIVGSGTKKQNALDLAHKLFKKYAEQENKKITYQNLMEYHGVGTTKACRIVACFELGQRLFNNKRTVLVLSPEDVWKELDEIRIRTKEYFVIFYLDVRNQIIKKEIVSIGTLNMSVVHPREVFENAIRHSAAQILISHNHPSGDPNPSDEDMELTSRLIESGKILGIEIIDHVIVCKEVYYSFKEHKIL